MEWIGRTDCSWLLQRIDWRESMPHLGAQTRRLVRLVPAVLIAWSSCCRWTIPDARRSLDAFSAIGQASGEASSMKAEAIQARSFRSGPPASHCGCTINNCSLSVTSLLYNQPKSRWILRLRLLADR